MAKLAFVSPVEVVRHVAQEIVIVLPLVTTLIGLVEATRTVPVAAFKEAT